MDDVGTVVIGRNEGERLRRCLAALRETGAPTVYVDSGSTDGSVAVAQALGCAVVSLDPARPFSAGRARNEGFARLRQLAPHVRCVQFVDGDCELAAGWLARAARELEARPEAALVCGRLRERRPDDSIYNRLCDLEWHRPVGADVRCGGLFMIRASAFLATEGFDPGATACEEPELCQRLRQRGWEIVRVEAEMARHDATMTSFRQWARRTLRGGYGFAQEAALQGERDPRRRGWPRETLSIWLWAAVLPAAVLALGLGSHGWGLLLGLAYPVQVARITVRRHRQLHTPWPHAWLYAGFCMLGKFWQLTGQCRFHLERWRGAGARVIEYRAPAAPITPPKPRVSLRRRWRPAWEQLAALSGALARAERELSAGLTILTYHRVLPDEQCPGYPLPALVMPVSLFRQQMRYLAAHYEIGTLGDLLPRLAAGPGSRPRLCVTFDDGYLDNYQLAAPLLEEAGLRATFFVTVGLLGTPGRLWTDQAALAWAFGPRADLLRRWRELTPDSRQPPLTPAGAMAQWMRAVKECPPEARARLLAAAPEPVAATLPWRFELMGPEQARDLRRRGHEIGSHTWTHALLPQLGTAQLAAELAQSRCVLESLLGAPVAGFSYPNGDHDARIVAAVREAGYRYACTTAPGLNRPGADPLRLARVHVSADHVRRLDGRHDPLAFRIRLAQWHERRPRDPGPVAAPLAPVALGS